MASEQAKREGAQEEETNEHGCPLHTQPGHLAVKNFARIVARLSPELRAALEAERARLQAELEEYLSARGYRRQEPGT